MATRDEKIDPENRTKHVKEITLKGAHANLSTRHKFFISG